jgi:hypothetical protein
VTFAVEILRRACFVLRVGYVAITVLDGVVAAPAFIPFLSSLLRHGYIHSLCSTFYAFTAGNEHIIFILRFPEFRGECPAMFTSLASNMEG